MPEPQQQPQPQSEALDPFRPLDLDQPEAQPLELPWYSWLILGSLATSLVWAWYLSRVLATLRKLKKRQELVDRARDIWERHLVDELNKAK